MPREHIVKEPLAPVPFDLAITIITCSCRVRSVFMSLGAPSGDILSTYLQLALEWAVLWIYCVLGLCDLSTVSVRIKLNCRTLS